MKKTKKYTNDILIVILIVILLVVFVLSFGNLDGDEFNIPKEFKDDKASAKSRHKKLTALIDKQEQLKQKLDKKFKRIYFGVRIVLVLLWVGVMFSLYLFNLITNLEDFLNYSEISILIIVTFNFLTFGTITNVKNYISFLKTKTENWVYGKYINLEIKINENKTELKKLEKEIK
jgi:hypothetical protein